MGKSSHAWNSFKSAFTAEGKDYVFHVAEQHVDHRPDGSRIYTQHYSDLWCSSTDYEEATDSMHHEIAREVSKYWMKKCGIPPILQMIVNGTCYVPRPIVFEAYGSMASYGEEWTSESPFREPRYVMLRKGILMGDPLTKVILHLVNILVRITGEHFANSNFIEKIFPRQSDSVIQYVNTFLNTETTGSYAPSKVKPVQDFVQAMTSASKEEDLPQVPESKISTPLWEANLDAFKMARERGFTFSLSNVLRSNAELRLKEESIQQDPKGSAIRDRMDMFKDMNIAHALRVAQQEYEQKIQAKQEELVRRELRAKVVSLQFESLKARGGTQANRIASAPKELPVRQMENESGKSWFETFAEWATG
jgi:hypothetical protein